jgi:hypothetical protein
MEHERSRQGGVYQYSSAEAVNQEMGGLVSYDLPGYPLTSCSPRRPYCVDEMGCGTDGKYGHGKPVGSSGAKDGF